jgi:hypothetical protein
MKRVFALLVIGLALTVQPVTAAPWDYRPGLQQQDRRNPPRQFQNDRREQRPAPQRDDRRHRLTDEERRDLRRDLDRANRELYPQKRPR